MFLTFSKTLTKMMGVRIGAGIRLRGWMAFIAWIFIAMGYLLWWSLIAVGWGVFLVAAAVYYIYLGAFKLIKWLIPVVISLISGMRKKKQSDQSPDGENQ